MEKFLEWDSLARSNNVDAFEREIPINLLSNNITMLYYNDPISKTASDRSNRKNVTISFQFKWKPLRPGYFRGGHLDILSNDIRIPLSNGSFIEDVNPNDARLFLNKTADEEILHTIQQCREDNLQDELDKLFR
ncbi:MAG: hypothetical protein LBH43_12315 [Treponema sp.]|jgi:hypothetical protein|nr:hypothetical protein [Treponema sp.]